MIRKAIALVILTGLLVGHCAHPDSPRMAASAKPAQQCAWDTP